MQIETNKTYHATVKTNKVWVSCKVEECVPCTRMVRHVSCVPTVQKVCTFNHVQEQVTVPVTSFRCVPEVVAKTCTVGCSPIINLCSQ